MAADIENLRELQIIELEGIQINEFCPLPNGEGKTTEVHLALTPKGHLKTRMIVRIKSRGAADQIINALAKHRDSVWRTN